MSMELAKQPKVPGIALDSLGCKLNQAEMELLARQISEAGYRVVSAVEEADVYILNTCTVTQVADRKSRHRLRLAHRRNPSACLVVTGCYAERSPQEIARIDGVSLVLGNEQKPHLLRILEEAGYLHRPNEADSAFYRQNGVRTRALVKVQDGCHNFCSYCIVPLVRCNEFSVPVSLVVDAVRQRVNDGYQEVVLTGTEIGSYHWGSANLRALLERILAETAVPRLRLSSLQPREISPGLVHLWRNPRLCPHFHLSLQSGSDTVLRRMRRRYTANDYRQAVSLIGEVVPGAAVTTDVIVGFPGETDSEFEESYEFCRQMDFARIHVFPYSPRPGTAAVHMPDMIADQIKKPRRQRMLALAEECARNFRNRFLGTTMEVLWERRSRGIWSGLTGNYIKVYARSSADLVNKLVPVKLVCLWKGGVWGEVL